MKWRLRMKMMVLAISISLLLEGCQIKDIDRRGFVVSIGFDQPEHGNKKVKVTLKVAVPKGDPKQGNENFTLIVEESNSIAEALRMAKSKVERELDFGHTKVILLGEKLVQNNDISFIADWASRRRDIQLIGYVAVATPSAEKVLGIKPLTERIPSNTLFLDFDQEGTESPFIVTEYVFDLQRRITEFGIDPIVPIIEAQKDKLVVAQAAVFDDGRISTTLTENETRLYNFLTTRNVRTSLSVTMNGHLFSVNVESSKADYKIKRKWSGRPYVEYKLKIEGNLEEEDVQQKIDKPLLDQISRRMEEMLNHDIQKLLVKLQKKQVDPIGFGLRYVSTSWNNKEERMEWEELYPELEFQIHPVVRITSTGQFS